MYTRRGFGLNGIPQVTKNLLIINVILFVLTQIGLATQRYNLIDLLALRNPLSPLFQPYQLVTHFFMHGSLSHIFFNMFTLIMFGRVLEGVWGSKKFFIYYFFTAFGAALLHIGVEYIRYFALKDDVSAEALQDILTNGATYIMQGKNYVNETYRDINIIVNTPMLGASGAVFGVLMAFGMIFPNVQLMLLFPPIPIKGKYIAIFALVLGVVLGFRSNVAHFAHLGGMVFGYILIKYWKKKPLNY